MSCDPSTALTSSDIANAKDNFTTIKTVVESNLDTATTPNGKTIDTVAGALKKIGWETPAIAYSGGISFTSSDGRKLIERNSILYAPMPSEIPFTTSGTWTGDDEDKFSIVSYASDPTTFATKAALQSGQAINGITVSFSDMASQNAQVFTVISDSDAKKNGHAYIVKTRAQHRTDISDAGWVPDGARDFYLDGGTTYVAVRKSVTKQAQRERLKSLIASGGMVWSILGDSTEAGVGAGGGAYAQTTQERLNGWANYAFYYMMQADPSFISLNHDAYSVAQPFLANSSEVGATLSLPYPSWQATKGNDPEIEFTASNSGRTLRDKFTIYVDERTSDAAAIFRLTVRRASDDLLLYQGNIDTYTAQETFGAAGSFNVGGRVGTRRVTLSQAERYVKVTIDNFATADRGSGVAADGTAAIYGFTFGDGLEIHNLAVSSTTLKEGSAANVSRGVDTSERLALAQSFSSNVYTIGFGTNDSKVGVSTLDNFRAEYYQLIRDILTGDPDAIITLCNDPRGKSGSIYELNPAYNAVVREIADDFGLIFLDVEKMSDSLPDAFYSDDVHPSSEGVFQLVQAFCDLVDINAKNFTYSRVSTSAGAVAGEFEIADATPIPTSIGEIFSQVIPRKGSATFLIVRADIVLLDDTNSNVNVSADLKINGVIVDEKRVATVDASGFTRLQMSLNSVFEFGASATYDISLDMVDHTSNGTTEIETRSTVSYMWI